MKITDADRKVVAKVLKAKSPQAALAKVAGEKKRKAPDLVWGWLAAGVVPFEGDVVNLAYDCADTAKPELVIQAAGRFEANTLRIAKAMYSCAKSYRAHTDAWTEATLSPLVNDVLAYARVEAGEKLAKADRDRLLDFYAEAAVDGKHTFGQRLAVFVTDQLRLSREAFAAAVMPKLTTASGMNFDTSAAMEAAPWSDVEKVLRATPAQDIANGFFMASIFRAHPEVSAATLFALCGGHRAKDDIVMAILDRARDRNEEVPAIDDALAEMLADGADQEVANKVAQLPAPRRAAIGAKLADLDTDGDEACWGFLPDTARDAAHVASIVEPVRAGLVSHDWDATYEALSDTLSGLRQAGFHGVAIIDRALAALAKDKRFASHPVGAQTRLMLKRVAFSAMKGGTRDLALLMPGADLDWVETKHSVIGDNDLEEELTAAELTAFRTAWHTHNWDGTLDFDDSAPVAIADRPWAELTALVAQTSFRRLCDGEESSQSVTQLFARDVSLAKKLALAQTIAARAVALLAIDPTDMRGLRAIVAILMALLPQVHDAERALDGDLADCAYTILRNDAPDEVVELLARLPRKQVEGWIEKLCSDKSAKIKKRGKALAAQLH